MILLFSDCMCVCALCSARRGVPETMVNMEVWIPAGYNLEAWMTNGQLVNGGLLGPFGRYCHHLITIISVTEDFT